MLVLARQRRGHAEELFAGRPRPHGRGRQDFRDLRILQRELRVRARRGRGQTRVERLTSMRAALLAFVMLIAPQAALAQSCPAPLNDARRLVLVVADTPSSTTATVERFERDAPNAPWQLSGGAATALDRPQGSWLGATRFVPLRAGGEPVKVEGDKRAPAGFYKIGRSFGFAVSDRAGLSAHHRRHDLRRRPVPRPPTTPSPRAPKIGLKVHGENMWRVPEYARGLLVEYPDRRARRAPAPAFLSTCDCPGKPAPAAASLAGAATRGRAGFCGRMAPCWRCCRGRRSAASRAACRRTLIDRPLGVG